MQAKERPSEPMGRNTLSGVYDICVGDHESLNLILNRMKYSGPIHFPVIPGQSSVRNGEAGSPSLLNKLHIGLSAQA